MKIPYKQRDNLKIQFGMWLGMPAYARQDDEKTQESFSKKIGVQHETLSRWKKDPLVIDTAENAIKIWGANDKLEVVKGIIEKAKEGNPAMARLYMEWQGEISTKKSTGVENREFQVKLVTE
jgi:hypothetical protein